MQIVIVHDSDSDVRRQVVPVGSVLIPVVVFYGMELVDVALVASTFTLFPGA